MTTRPLLLLELLSNRSLSPGAIVLHISSCEGNFLCQLAENEVFTELSKAFPCFLPAKQTEGLPPDQLKRMQETGCTFILPDSLYDSNDTFRPLIPDSANWMSGQWYLATPPRPPVNQSAPRTLAMKLLQLVANDAETREIEEIFRHDPVLAYHLLRLVNSLGMGMNRHISNFSQAILILGRQQLKRWLNLMLFTANRNDYRSAMLTAHVAIRARSMELLAEAVGLDHAAQEKAFMAGMFSLLGVLFGLPLDEVLAPLNLNEALSAAVRRNEGELGQLKLIAESAEQLDSDAVRHVLDQTGLSPVDFNRITLDAHLWMLGIIHEKQEPVDA